MSADVPKETREKTTKCAHAFSCLDTGKCGERGLCDVSYAAGENVLFLKWKETGVCPYRLSFGYGQICTCPTHFSLRGRYFVAGDGNTRTGLERRVLERQKKDIPPIG